jgi:hypothetical protein
MSDSITSSDDLNINLLNLAGPTMNDKKVRSSTTDMYNNLIANPIKEKEVIQETSSITKSSSDDNSSLDDSSTLSDKQSSDKPVLKQTQQPINIPNKQHTRPHKISQSSDSVSSESHVKKSKKHNKDNLSSQTYSPVNIQPSNTNINMNAPLSSQQIRMKKIELLRKLSEIKSKGFELSKKYDFKSSIEEMEYEYELLKSFAHKRNGIKLYKNIILNTASAFEFLNDRYDPFNFKLSGWSEHMSVEVDSYEDVLEELYEKYKGKGSSMPSEIKLLLLMVTSASAFHFTKSYAQNSVIETAFKNNPGMIADMFNKKK